MELNGRKGRGQSRAELSRGVPVGTRAPFCRRQLFYNWAAVLHLKLNREKSQLFAQCNFGLSFLGPARTRARLPNLPTAML